jgi:hypothetical protein
MEEEAVIFRAGHERATNLKPLNAVVELKILFISSSSDCHDIVLHKQCYICNLVFNFRVGHA